MQSVYVSGAVLYFISPFRVGVFGLICQETCCFLSLEWASPRPEDFFPTGISSPGCTTTLHTSLNFCGLVWNLLISISCKNESWLMTESVFHHRLETDSCPCSLALDLIFLRESAKPFSPVTGCPNVDQLPAVGYKGNRRKESGKPVLRRVGVRPTPGLLPPWDPSMRLSRAPIPWAALRGCCFLGRVSVPGAAAQEDRKGAADPGGDPGSAWELGRVAGPSSFIFLRGRWEASEVTFPSASVRRSAPTCLGKPLFTQHALGFLKCTS